MKCELEKAALKKKDVATKKFWYLARSQWPRWFWSSVLGHLPENSKREFCEGKELGEGAWLDISGAFGVSVLFGYGNDTPRPRWIAETKAVIAIMLESRGAKY